METSLQTKQGSAAVLNKMAEERTLFRAVRGHFFHGNGILGRGTVKAEDPRSRVCCVPGEERAVLRAL